MKKITIIAALCIITTALYGNPFFSGKPDTKAKEQNITAKTESPGIRGEISEKMKLYQKEIRENISGYFDEIKNRNYHYIFYAIMASLLYGILHAIGPGHGKITLSSYVMAKAVSTGRTVWMGFLSGFSHAMSSLIVISVIILIFEKSIVRNFESVQNNLTNISFAIICAIGIFLAAGAIRLLLSRNTPPAPEEKNTRLSKLSAAPVIISAGIIPCPGAAIILIFSYTMGLYIIGIICVTAMSLGMGLTIGITAAAVSVARKTGDSMASRKNISRTVFGIFQMAGGIVLIITGIAWFTT